MAFAGDMVINLLGNTAPLERSLGRARVRIRTFGGSGAKSFKTFGSVAGGVLSLVAKAAMKTAKALGFVVTAVAGLSISKNIEFDDSIRKAGARARATEKGLEDLRAKAKELGVTTSFTATEIATMMEALGKGGFSTAEIEGMTKSVAALARATGTEASTAGDLLAITMKVFSKEVGEASGVADMFTVVANNSLTSVEELAEGWKFAAAAAAATNTSAEELAAGFGTLANAGLKGSVAGTAMRRMLTLSAAEAAKMNEIFGVAFKDANNGALSLNDQMFNVSVALQRAQGDTEKMAMIYEAFGLRGVTATAALTDGIAETDLLLAKINNSAGEAQETMEKIEEGPGGAWRLFKSAVEGLRIEIGEKLTPAFMTAMAFMTKWTRTAIEFIRTRWTGWQEWMERMFTIIGTTWRFMWDNAGDILKLMVVGSLLRITQFAETFKYYMLTVLPAAVGWFVENFHTLFLDGAAYVGIAMRNMVDNIIELWNEALNWVESKGFNPDLKELGDGFEALFREDLEIPDRVKSDLEKEMEQMTSDLQNSLGTGLGEAIANDLADLALMQQERRDKELDDTQKEDPLAEKRAMPEGAGAGPKGAGPQTSFVGAQMRGSADALKTILRAGKTDEEATRLRKIAEQQLKIAKQQEEHLRHQAIAAQNEMRRNQSGFIVIGVDTP